MCYTCRQDCENKCGKCDLWFIAFVLVLGVFILSFLILAYGNVQKFKTTIFKSIVNNMNGPRFAWHFSQKKIYKNISNLNLINIWTFEDCGLFSISLLLFVFIILRKAFIDVIWAQKQRLEEKFIPVLILFLKVVVSKNN